MFPQLRGHKSPKEFQKLYNFVKYFIFTNFNLDVDIKGHATLFEDIKRGYSARKIHFTSVPVIIMGMKRLDCAHGVDRCVLSKKKKNGKQN